MVGFKNGIKRRRVLQGAFTIGLSAFATSLIPKVNVFSKNGANSLEFKSISANTLDTVTLPNGFSWYTISSWGDPLWSTSPEFDHLSRGTGSSQEVSVGDNNDGMSLFDIGGSSVLAVNNESCNRGVIFGNRVSGLPETTDDVRKGMASHGVSIFEIKVKNGKWSIKKDSVFNRRITANTPISLTGPAKGHALLKTEEDPKGKMVKGTFNNCGCGRTPWGTYLTCEENFNYYFSVLQPGGENMLTEEQQRYGLRANDKGYNWAMNQERFNIGKNPNEPNRHGYIVEIDPSNPNSIPKKHTAMGRFKHENCEIVLTKDNHIVAYMGDDEKGEFLYKFISKGKFIKGHSSNLQLLTEGDLFVAVFEENGTGKWVNLKESEMGEAEVCVFSRIAATKVGATSMDRPEWIAANPHKIEAYCALTNNNERGVIGKNQTLNSVNPRENNIYGHILRWIPEKEDHGSSAFSWDLFLMAGNPSTQEGINRGSSNITEENMFNSPDGIAFDTIGNLWIRTDGNYSNSGDFMGMGNNQMLIADTNTGEVKRFLVGPKEAEITGQTWSLDKKTMFVGIQHPGEKNPEACHFPQVGKGIPRSSIIAITRDDGGLMG